MQILFSILFSVFFNDLPESDLQIRFSGIEPSKGKVYINIYDKKSAFLKPELAVYKYSFDSRQNTQEVIKLKLSNYLKISIACFQDINGNQKLDTNTFGIPTEPYAFSNNARGKWKKPTWDDAAFKFNPGLLVDLKLHYW
ncbi:MAG: DUF2141 domain-containing protein [Saprospiraceae bacterium]|jgi:uncharacterized protein (DUF2141 family)|nr:DUF2141 domain-containing protein [Saprospiraceae bacterium]